MFDIALTLKQDEAEALASSIQDNIRTWTDYLPSADLDEMAKGAFELSVLAKLLNVLPKKEKDSDATNDTVQFPNYLNLRKSPAKFGDLQGFFSI